MCFSPVGNKLRDCSRKFPAMVSCTAIDWFHEWPQEALESVSFRFLQAVENIEVRKSLILQYFVDGIVHLIYNSCSHKLRSQSVSSWHTSTRVSIRSQRSTWPMTGATITQLPSLSWSRSNCIAVYLTRKATISPPRWGGWRMACKSSTAPPLRYYL